MTLNDFVERLQKLQAEGHGAKEVFATFGDLSYDIGSVFANEGPVDTDGPLEDHEGPFININLD